jgi:hypothetical protein
MPLEAAILLATFILVTTFVVMLTLIASRLRDAKEQEMKRAASARGWQFQTLREKGRRVHRWTGTTDGVSWVAESRPQTGRSNSRHQQRHYISRWHGNYSSGITGVIVAMGLPKGKENLGHAVATFQGWFFAKLANAAAGYRFDKAIDSYFGEGPGKEVDASAMHRVETRTPGFIVMTSDKHEGARIVSQGFERAIVDASNDSASVLSHEDRPWILLRPNAISLARMERYRDIKELESFVRTGVSLTRAFKFGRAQ